MPQARSEPPALPTRTTPAPAQRQAACTHVTVTRLYDNYGSYRCQVCRKHPNIGWVYRCTQDHGGFLPESDFNTTTPDTGPIIVSKGTSVWRLKQWMYEAVTKGQYTVEQFSTLFQQRQGVKKAIFSHNEGTTTLSTVASSAYSKSPSDLANTTLASIASSYPDESPELDPGESAFSHKAKDGQITAGQQPLDERNIDVITSESTENNPSYPACTWTCCQTCRPTYRDRAWQSIDAIANGSVGPTPLWELENRRISNTKVVASIGLPKPVRPVQVDDSRHDSSSGAPLSTCSNRGEPETDTFSSGSPNGTHTKGGIRATVRRTLKGAISHKRATSSERPASHRNSSQSSLRALGRAMLFWPHGPPQSKGAYSPRVIEDGQLQESLMLLIACNTPLPDAAADVGDLHDAEVEVEDGVAVTEEGIGMGAADIMMQV